VELYFPKNSQGEIRQIQGATAEFERLSKEENIGPLKWRSTPLWSQAIAVKVDNVEDTVSEIADIVLRLYSVIAQFERWLLDQPK
jgi:hypothetical protein